MLKNISLHSNSKVGYHVSHGVLDLKTCLSQLAMTHWSKCGMLGHSELPYMTSQVATKYLLLLYFRQNFVPLDYPV